MRILLVCLCIDTGYCTPPTLYVKNALKVSSLNEVHYQRNLRMLHS